MSSSVDNRVVQMGFDNKQFETNVKQSTQSLDTLKKSLNLEDAVKGLSALSLIGKNFSLDQMAKGIENISSKFGAMGAIGFTVIQNLTNAAMDFAKKLVGAFTAPIKQGLNEYETQINAVQTILANTASKGTNIEQVNKALDELNTYSDKTIYNFTEMAKNIGTFTAAGVELDTSVAAIKGIANLAAVSGSSSQQAAVGMYQLSQAISTGTVRLMDWNSVQNAGMGGEVFQTALLETARVHGVAVDDMIAKQGSFRASLSEEWLSSEILLETLSKFTGDLNEDQLRTMGYTEEQIQGIIKLGQTASDAATKIKTFTQLKGSIQEAIVSGWAQSWRILVGDFEEAKALFTEISDTLGPIIQRSSDARNKILQAWSDWGGRTLLIDALRDSFGALMDILEPIGEAFREVFPVDMLGTLKKITTAIWLFSQRLKITGGTADKIKRIFKGVFSLLSLVTDIIFTLVKAFFGLGKAIPLSGAGILDFLANIGDFLTNLRESIDVAESFKWAIQKIKEVLSSAKITILEFADAAKKKFQEIKKWLKDVFDIDINLPNFGKIALSITSFMDSLKNIKFDTSAIGAFFSKIKSSLSGLGKISKGTSTAVGGIKSKLEELAPSIKEGAKSIGTFLSKAATTIKEGVKKIDFNKLIALLGSGILGAVLLTIRKFIKSGADFIDQASSVFGGIVGVLDGVKGSLTAWQNSLKAKTILMIAGAIAILAVALIALSMVDPKKLLPALAAITTLFADLSVSMAAFNKFGGAGASTLGLIGLSVAVLIMSGALIKLSEIEPDKLVNGIKGILTITGGILVFSKVMSKESGSILKGSIALLIFAKAFNKMAKVVEKFSELPLENLNQGLKAMAIMLLEIAGFMRIVNGTKLSPASALAIVGVTIAIMILGEQISKFGKMPTAQLEQGLKAIGASLGEIALFTKLSGGPAKSLASAAAMIVIAFALEILAKSLQTLGEMDMEVLKQGIMAMGASLLILAVGLSVMSGTVAGSLALMLAIAALYLLAPVLLMLGSLSLATIGTALLALAGVFLVLGVAGLVLAPVVPVIMALALAMLLMGAAAILLGVGLLAFSAGLAALAATGMAAALVIVGMVTALLALVPLIISTLILAIILFAEGIIKATPIVLKAITGMLVGILDAIIEIGPKLFETLDVLINGLLDLIEKNAPRFITVVIRILLILLKRIAEKVPEFVDAGFEILIGFLNGIRDNIPEVVTAVTEIIVAFLEAVGDNIDEVTDAGWKLMLDFITGLSNSVDDNLPVILTAVGTLAANIITGLVEGIAGGAIQVLNAIVGLITGGTAAAQAAAEAHSPSKVFMRIGKTFPQGMAIGISKYGKLVSTATENIVSKAIEGAKGISSALTNALNADLDMSPTIRPVIDMSDIVTGNKLIDDMIGRKTLNLVPAMTSSSNIASNMNRVVDSEGNIITEGAKIQLTQINNSPKALSRIEIYRQTRNQLRALKGLVENT